MKKVPGTYAQDQNSSLLCLSEILPARTDGARKLFSENYGGFCLGGITVPLLKMVLL
jgi:hypothetical protein